MTNQAMVAAPHAGAIAVSGGFTREQLDLLKRTVADGTSDDEFALFLEVAKASGLNPFQRQVYAIMRDTYNPRTKAKEPKMTIQTGIDGYRLIAARTGLHAGTSDADYGPKNEAGFPEWARVTVKKMLANGAIADFTVTARWDEYAQMKDEYDRGQKTGRQTPSGQWGKMPYLMLAKCAEALALRKAFPGELSGVYTAEEMSQADGATHAPTTPQVATTGPTARITEAQRERLFETAGRYGVTHPALAELMKANAMGVNAQGKPDTTRLTVEQYEALCDTLIPAEGKRIEAERDALDDITDADFEEIAAPATQQ